MSPKGKLVAEIKPFENLSEALEQVDFGYCFEVLSD